MLRRALMEEDKTITSEQLELHLEGCNPQQCVMVAHSPSVQVYYALHSKLEQSDETWLQEFISLDGLSSLLESLHQMSVKTFTSFSDAILQLDCISCIRTILNTRVGLEYFLNSDKCAKKLGLALDISNTLPKKQVIEILSAVCVFSSQGYDRVMETLEFFKRETNQSHKFSVIISELKSAETVPYKTCMLTFINCLINCCDNIIERTRSRNAFIGLQLLDVLSFLQREEKDDDLHVQLETFYKRKHEDEVEMEAKCNVDLSSPQDLTDKIQEKVFGTPKMAAFVNILQDLLALEVSNKGTTFWHTIENQVHYLVHSNDTCAFLEKSTPEDIDSVVTNEINTSRESMLKAVSKSTSVNKLGSTVKKTSQSNTTAYDNINPNGPKILNNLNTLTPYKRSWNHFNSILKMKEAFEGKSVSGDEIPSPRTRVPMPTKPMKSVKWIKLEDNIVEANGNSIWSQQENIPRVQPDFRVLETLFNETRVFEDYDEVPLLSQNVRLNVNLFLNRLEVEPEELVRNLVEGDPSTLSLPMLKYLNKILPDHDEILMLKTYTGNLLELGLGEQFLLHLSDVPDYRALINGHLTRAEFTSNIQRLKTSLRATVSVCRFILDSPDLREILHFVLKIGNFLNHGQYNGNAAGYKLTSLERLSEVKSAMINQTLIHYIVQVVIDSDETMLKFLAEIPKLEKAASVSPEDIKLDVTKMNLQMKQFVHQLSRAHPAIQDIFHFFMEDVKSDFKEMQTSISDLRSLSQQMAQYFCEMETDFNLQKCLQTILDFCKELKKCRKENILFQKQRNLARRRSDQFQQQIRLKNMALQFGKEAKASSSVLEDKKKILEKIINDLRRGNFKPPISCMLSLPFSELSSRRENVTPHHSKAVTPESEVSPLDLSSISVVGTPMVNRPRSEAFEDDFFAFPTSTARARPKVLTSSENNLLDSPAQNLLKQMKTAGSANRVVGHYRSKSDLTGSITITSKWQAYEALKQKELWMQNGQAPLAKPESLCTLATLNLEDHGKTYGRNEMSVHEGPIITVPKPITKDMKKMEKKSSFSNFFSKISRAVLKPRNTNYNCYRHNNTTMLQREGTTLLNDDYNGPENKENAVVPPSVVEKRYATREYKRFKAQRQKASQSRIK